LHDWTISWEHNAVTGYCLHQGVPHTNIYILKMCLSPFIGGGGGSGLDFLFHGL
jgi:hypothetical protein